MTLLIWTNFLFPTPVAPKRVLRTPFIWKLLGGTISTNLFKNNHPNYQVGVCLTPAMQGSNHSNHYLENVVHSAILPWWISTHKELSMLVKCISSPIQGCTCRASLHLMSPPGTPTRLCWRGGGVDTLQSLLIPRDHRWSGIIQVLGSYECHVILGQVYDPIASINQMDIIFQGCCSLGWFYAQQKHVPENLFKRHLSKWVRPLD